MFSSLKQGVWFILIPSRVKFMQYPVVFSTCVVSVRLIPLLAVNNCVATTAFPSIMLTFAVIVLAFWLTAYVVVQFVVV